MKSEAADPPTMQQALSPSVPAFLAKLWAMVNEDSTDSVIGWTEDNKSFYIRNQSVFSMELLPVYYKHNNLASFVRQLNMYGFRKVLSPLAGSLRNESDEMIFAHPDFVRDEPWGLDNIKRKIPHHHKDLPSPSGELLARLYSEVKTMKGKQDSLDSHLGKMKRENESLWREVLVLRQKHAKQQQIVNKLIQFLVSFVQPGRTAAAATSMGLKRKQLPMLEGGGPAAKAARLGRAFSVEETGPASVDSRPMTSSSVSSGPVIHDVTDQVTSPPGSVVIGGSPAQVSPTDFIASPGTPAAAAWAPLAESLAPPAGPSGDPGRSAEEEQDQQRQGQPDTTVALPTGADPSQEMTPVLCDSLLESIQADLDGLRGLIGSPNWRMDASSVQNILQDPEQTLTAAAPSGGGESDQQLVSIPYNPSLLDLFSADTDELFPDLKGLEEAEEETEAEGTGAATGQDSSAAVPPAGSGLNTPTVELRGPPAFPVVPSATPSATWTGRKAGPEPEATAGGRRSELHTPTIEIVRTPFPPPPSKTGRKDATRRRK